MTVTSSSVERQFEVLMLYHPDDRGVAKQLQSLLTPEKGFTCCLLYDHVASNILTEIFMRSDEADCVISLLTERLFNEEKILMYHRSVLTRLKGERFIPINVNVSTSVIDSPRAGFLEGCNVLKANWSSEEFRERLMNMLASVKSRDGTPTKNVSAAVSPSSPGSSQPSQQLVCARTLPPGTQTGGRAVSGINPVPGGRSLLRRTNSDPGLAGTHPSLVRSATYAVINSTSTAADLGIPALSALPEPESERTDPRLAEGSRNHQRKHRMSDGEQIEVARKQLWCREYAGECLRREKAAKFLRSPFIIPTLAIKENRPGLVEIITPSMPNGNLEDLLNPQTTSLFRTWLREHGDVKACLVTIVYQVSEAIDFLHSRGFVHGNINPRAVLIDCHRNARLGDFGKSLNIANTDDAVVDQTFKARRGYEDPNSSSVCYESDIFAYGIILLQTLKWNSPVSQIEGNHVTLYHRLLQDHKGALPEADKLISDSKYVEQEMWTTDRITRSLCQTAVESLRCPAQRNERMRAPGIKKRLIECMTLLQLPLINFPQQQKCVYCKVGKLNGDLQAESSGCSEKCEFLQICPSCMQLAHRNGFSCPRHSGARIWSPIGGERACALIITGSDSDNQDTQDTFQEDCRKMSLLASHPRIFGIPRQNVYQIAPYTNSTESEIHHVLSKISTEPPFSFLLYYSGHPKLTEDKRSLDVSSEQGRMLDADQLQKFLTPLVHSTCQVLVVLDCCNAAAMKLLPQLVEGASDGHLAWHIEWPSCGRREDSNIDQGNTNSVFTKYILSGLSGASKCPDRNEVHRESDNDCSVCTEFRKKCAKTQCITMSALDKYVRDHMNRRFREGRDDTQRPIVSRQGRKEPVLAYFTQQPLYRFQYQSPNKSEKCVCELDYIGFDIDDVLLLLWNKLKARHLHRCLDHRTLDIFQRLNGSSVSKCLRTSDDIIDALCEDENSLFVTIRTNGTELGEGRWVACFCDAPKTTESVRCLGIESVADTTDCPTDNAGVITLQLTRLSKEWKPKEDNEFDKVLMTCWRTFCELEKKKKVESQSSDNENCLRVEIREKLSMFSIKQLPKDDRDTKVLEYAE